MGTVRIGDGDTLGIMQGKVGANTPGEVVTLMDKSSKDLAGRIPIPHGVHLGGNEAHS